MKDDTSTFARPDGSPPSGNDSQAGPEARSGPFPAESDGSRKASVAEEWWTGLAMKLIPLMQRGNVRSFRVSRTNGNTFDFDIEPEPSPAGNSVLDKPGSHNQL